HRRTLSLPDALPTPRARAARLWHPRLPAEPVERLGVLPDPFERVVAHVLERQRGDPARRVPGPYFPRRCDGHIGARPATHTRLGKLLMIVGEDPDGLERGPEAGAGARAASASPPWTLICTWSSPAAFRPASRSWESR